MRYQICWSNPATNEAGALGGTFENGYEADKRAADEEKANPGRVYWATPVPEGRRTGVDPSGTDWDALDAMTDEDIQRQVDENPDVAPIITDFSGFTLVKPPPKAVPGQYDPTLFWGGEITAHYPTFYRECCICHKEIEHGEVYDTSRSQPVLSAHTECRKLADNHPMRDR